MRTTIKLALGVALLALAPVARAADVELKLVVGSWCPFECTPDEAGGLKGFVTDVAVAVLERHGVRTQLVTAGYLRGIELVMDNQAQVLIGIAKEDAPELVYPVVEQGLTGHSFFVRADNPWRYTGVKSFEQLGRVGIMQGYDYAELNDVIARNPQRVETVSGSHNARRNIHKLLAGRVDAIIHDANVTIFELKHLDKVGALVPAGSLRNLQNVYVAFSPKFADARHYAELMSRGTEDLRQSGELAAILERYGLQDWKTR